MLIAENCGQTGENDADVNGNVVVNVTDLLTVAAILDDAAAAPVGKPLMGGLITPADVEGWLTLAQG